MANIQKALDALQPYVIGIRYLEGTVLVDTIFKEGWTVPEDPSIKRVKGATEEINYYMIFSEVESIGLDELLAYVDKTIKLNLDREKKHDLLRLKVNELKEVFKKNSLTKLQRLKFTFGEEDLMPSISDIDDLDIDYEDLAGNATHKPITKISQVEQPEEEDTDEAPTNTVINSYLDEHGQPIELSEEDKEILEEEARAERNRKILANKKQQPAPIKNLSKKVELPPKRKLEIADTMNYDTDCECGPNEACGKCVESKDY